MQDGAIEIGSPGAILTGEPQGQIPERQPTAIHPDMEGRATPLTDHPENGEQIEALRKGFGEMEGGGSSAGESFEEVGLPIVDPPTSETEFPKRPQRRKGFMDGLWEKFINFFRNLFR